MITEVGAGGGGGGNWCNLEIHRGDALCVCVCVRQVCLPSSACVRAYVGEMADLLRQHGYVARVDTGRVRYRSDLVSCLALVPVMDRRSDGVTSVMVT